jgi:LytS/YehU family sensor histidine kinase
MGIAVHTAIDLPWQYVILGTLYKAALFPLAFLVSLYGALRMGLKNFRQLKPWAASLALISALCVLDSWPIYVFTRAHLELFPKGGDTYTSLSFIMRQFALLGSLVVYIALYKSKLHRLEIENYAAAAITARESEMSRLRAQINPHFLFNSLNTIIAEAADPTKVERLALGLNELLRFNLTHSKDVAPLGEELAVIEHYLDVEKIRFEDGLNVEVAVSPAAAALELPKPLLLPLIENAIKYGRQTHEGVLTLRIRAEVVGESVEVSVENSGRWVEPAEPSAQGLNIGLNNLRQRLALVYGPGERLSVEKLPHSIRVTLKLPHRSNLTPSAS